MIQVRTYDVLLVAASEKDLVEAERQMKKELVCKRITIEDRRVIQMPEWDSVRINMADLLNTEKTMVLMDAIPTGAEKEVVIYGLSSAVDIAYQQIHEFLMENTVVQEEIVVKSRAIVEFIEKEILDVARYNINITRKDNGIRLSGPKQYVKERAEHLRSAISKLHSETLYIDKPGAKKFCLENEDGNAKYALSMYRCAIHLEKDGQGEAVALEINLNEPLCRLTLENGVTIAVHADNPYQQKVGVVVIVTSEDLKPMGGLEQTLHNDLVRAECEAVIQKEGKLAAGESIITNAGNLPCKQLIHVVSPKSGSKSKGPLCKAVKSVLDLAAKNGHTSIALSASSFAACGYPVETCTECIVTAIQQHMESQEGSSSIRYIHLVDSEDRIVKAFIQSLSDEYEEKNIQFTSKQEVKKLKAQKSKNDGGAADKYNRQMVTTKEGLKIKIIQGNIQDATSNVIVNSVGKELDLRSGAVSSAIFRKAGARLQDLLNREKPQSAVTDGCVFITDGCGLPCHLVLHAVVPRWDEGQGSSEQVRRNRTGR
ncbi:protein mono-ADP-ribosyltransferase PARP14-like, partial [Bufo gargarizans]|uniref:protein mono-ADP-ribosyltransferase PARP14-like n=1 Tax=Bufo gargarizans TaxID=30331 RepID=UPI001CF383C3